MEVANEDDDLKNLNILKEQAEENINKEELGDEYETVLPLYQLPYDIATFYDSNKQPVGQLKYIIKTFYNKCEMEDQFEDFIKKYETMTRSAVY